MVLGHSTRLIFYIFLLIIYSVKLTIPLSTNVSPYKSLNSTMKMQGPNLTAITWAHAVNSQNELDDALKSDVEMIEADIVLGKINNTGPDLPVMGHPPAVSSDITLKSFLYQILEHNQNATNKKGVKLDFKSIEVVEGSHEMLVEIYPLINYPIWLNADIVKGPVNNTETIPVDPDRFFVVCKDFPKAVLSIGWTTKWGNEYKDGLYADEEIKDMIDVINKNNVTDSKQKITFPVRAGIAANSETQLHKLVKAVNETNESSLTVWSSANDSVDIKMLRKLIFSFGLDRVYLDVPTEVSSKLELNKGPGNSAALPSLINFTFICVCVLVASLALRKALL